MPKVFSNEEYTDIHFVYGFCDGNARAAVREYQRRFPNRRVPDSSVFSNTHLQLRNLGSFRPMNEYDDVRSALRHRRRSERILNLRQNSWIQLDGCPSHCARQVRNWLDEHYAHRWIDRGGPVFWPPRSPDLTPLDFYLWATLKNKVYSTEVISLEDLKQRITNSVTEMQQNFQERRTVTNSVLRRCLACIDVQGQHFEMRH
ncbi:hypothetical protein X777_02360 [Ooceraea biroi]|uniref:DUF4817 domain-containing protein n=1 Tax=Ooceraea biroi TaxID=2015173 RepID=A0A026WLC9_OOCBI|nr:hypothetical protein X777_02360 [Ooceraea biroi]